MQHIVVMGVCGCGKSTIAQALAEHYGRKFIEADELHPCDNINRMRNGQALTDADRWPWLASVSDVVNGSALPVVVSCSALRRSYREFLNKHIKLPVYYVHLDGTRDLLSARMASRGNHFMPEALLDSQLATLEPLHFDEAGVQLDIRLSVHELVDAATIETNPSRRD